MVQEAEAALVPPGSSEGTSSAQGLESENLKTTPTLPFPGLPITLLILDLNPHLGPSPTLPESPSYVITHDRARDPADTATGI